MFKEIFRFELTYNFKRIAWWVFFVLLFIISFDHTVVTDPNHVKLFAHGQVFHNSPISIARVLASLSGLGLLFTVTLVATSVIRDFENHTHEFFFSSPVGKFGYLGGRFFGGLVSNLFLFVAPCLGIVFGCLSIDDSFSGPFYLKAYLYSIFVFVIPNLFLIGTVFFSLAALSRNMIATFVAGCVFIPAYLFVLGDSTQGTQIFIALFDPIGLGALESVTRYWSIAQKNSEMLPVGEIILYNRLIWFFVASAVWAFTYHRFRLTSNPESSRKKNTVEDNDVVKPVHFSQKPRIYLRTFSWLLDCKNSLIMSFAESRRLIFHPAFLILAGMAMLQAYRNFVANAGPNGSNVYPLTWWFIDNGSKDLYGYMIPITVFFTGVIVWKERDLRCHEIYGVLPLPNWAYYFSKLLTIWTVQLYFVFVTMLTGICAQAIVFGYTHFELDLYFKVMIGIDLTKYFMMAVLALLVQIVAGNKYLGYFIAAGLFFFIELQTFDSSALFRYGTFPEYAYSNINGFGNYAMPLVWYKIYWGAFSIVLMAAGDLLWPRGSETGIRHRWNLAKQRFSRVHKISVILACGVFIASGGWIVYNTRIENKFITRADLLERAGNYEMMYKRFEEMIQPDIGHVQVNADIYPAERTLKIKGFYTLKNNSQNLMDSIFVNLSSEKGTKILRMTAGENSKRVLSDAEYGVYIFKLDKPLAPQDTARLEFELVCESKGFPENDPNDDLLENGTFIDNFPFRPEHSYFPYIGYNMFAEIRGKYERSQYGLPEINGLPRNDDRDAVNRKIADLVTFDAIVSTSSDQTAIATGFLDTSWSVNGRNYYHFSVRTPMNNCFVITSGRYDVKKDRYKDVDIEVFFDADHAYNIDRMITGVKRALDYCTANFSPYPYPSLKIVEIPDYNSGGGTARSQPTVFTWRENGGFISNLEDSNAIDVVFNTTTHEMAHQWWGHIVRGAPVQGAGVMAETMAQWVRIMCMERELGKAKTNRFRLQEMDDYLSRRSRETDFEATMKNAGLQTYLNYDKGTIVMYALGNFLGEDRVNAALRRLVEKFGFKGAPFVTTSDLIKEFRDVTPDSLQYIITDLFERIIIYDNKTKEVTYEILPNGKYKVHLVIEVKKFEADGKGNETMAALNDYMDIGVFGKDEKELYLRKHRIDRSPLTVDIIVDEMPEKAGIDPHVILIDRDSENNMKICESLEGKNL